tara:strand:- start:413 stop:622 length:210 start_codon:yes stop_codon:yes gene_type:complete
MGVKRGMLRATKDHNRIEWSHNGERTREESCWYWECICGASEAASTKADAQREWIWHLDSISKREMSDD